MVLDLMPIIGRDWAEMIGRYWKPANTLCYKVLGHNKSSQAFEFDCRNLRHTKEEINGKD